MEQTAANLTKVVNNFLGTDKTLIDWDYKPSTEKWSKKEILGHLTDSATVNMQRFIRCTYEENFKLTYDQDAWVQAQNYQQADINRLFELWTLLNEQIVRVLKNYPAHRLKVQCDTGRTMANLHPIEWLANDYVDHLAHHLNQITNID